nr:MAG TPA: hypothetical protein [Caudoviricetes sp.]
MYFLGLKIEKRYWLEVSLFFKSGSYSGLVYTFKGMKMYS